MKKLIYSLLAFSMVGFMSCEEEATDTKPVVDEVVDLKPEVSIKSPQENDILWNEETISFNVVEDVKLKNAEVYIGTELVATLTEEPFETTISTKEFENGEHTIKILAYDTAGNQSEVAEVMVRINNNLLNIIYAPDAVIEGNRHIFITDNAGNHLVTVNATSSMAIERPADFDDATFNVHQVFNNSWDNQFSSLFGVTPGDMNFDVTERTTERIGAATLNFTDIPAHNYFTIGDGSYRSRSGSAIPASYNVDIHNDTDEAYIYLKSDAGDGYLYLDDLAVDQVYDISLANLNYEMTPKSFNINPSDFYITFFGARGVDSEDFYGTVKFMHRENAQFTDNVQSINYSIPTQNLFSMYSIYAFASNGSEEYSYWTMDNELGDDFVFLDGSIQVNNADINNLDIETTGEFDYASVWFSKYNSSTDDYSSWDATGAMGSDLKFPDIPADLLGIYPWLSSEEFTTGEYVWSGANVHELSNMDNYDDFINRYYSRGGLRFLDDLTQRLSYSVNLYHTTSSKMKELKDSKPGLFEVIESQSIFK